MGEAHFFVLLLIFAEFVNIYGTSASGFHVVRVKILIWIWELGVGDKSSLIFFTGGEDLCCGADLYLICE